MSKEDAIFELKDVVRQHLKSNYPQWEIIEIEDNNHLYLHIAVDSCIIHKASSSFILIDKEDIEQAKIEAYKKLILAITGSPKPESSRG